LTHNIHFFTNLFWLLLKYLSRIKRLYIHLTLAISHWSAWKVSQSSQKVKTCLPNSLNIKNIKIKKDFRSIVFLIRESVHQNWNAQKKSTVNHSSNAVSLQTYVPCVIRMTTKNEKCFESDPNSFFSELISI